MEKRNLLELKKMSLEEVKKYYQELRKYEYENDIPLKGIALRKKIHKLLLTIIKIDRLLAKETVTVINDERTKIDTPVIYACTHIGGNDIQRTFEAIKDHAYLFLGDPEGIYQDISGVLLYLNGVICLETDNKLDRTIAYERSLELLKKNGSLLIYPEGAWNITDNLPALKLYQGTVRLAKETNASIVPIAIEQYDNHFYVNIGKNYKLDENEDLTYANSLLRDKLATLKWDIWQEHAIKRTDVPTNYSEAFKQSVIDKCEYGFTVEDVYKTMYKDKNEASYEEVFAFQKRLSHK